MNKTDVNKSDASATGNTVNSPNKRIISREDLLVILSEIITGKSGKASISDIIEAARVLVSLQGWHVPNQQR
ncbi:hypothetical protein EZS27_008898 [termite gut metagenome]|uniref:Uncharacterized protein n=1 Tax=termite gut metagenome TaxID=433724 RepID=A0A5J4SBE8_9ZZZZ